MILFIDGNSGILFLKTTAGTIIYVFISTTLSLLSVINKTAFYRRLSAETAGIQTSIKGFIVGFIFASIQDAIYTLDSVKRMLSIKRRVFEGIGTRDTRDRTFSFRRTFSNIISVFSSVSTLKSLKKVLISSFISFYDSIVVSKFFVPLLLLGTITVTSVIRALVNSRIVGLTSVAKLFDTVIATKFGALLALLVSNITVRDNITVSKSFKRVMLITNLNVIDILTAIKNRTLQRTISDIINPIGTIVITTTGSFNYVRNISSIVRATGNPAPTSSGSFNYERDVINYITIEDKITIYKH